MLIITRNSNISSQKLRGEQTSNLLQLLKHKNKLKFGPQVKINTPE
jgi:hypothetical protein